MNKSIKIKLMYALGISLILCLIGCVDTSVSNIPESIDYHSQIQLVNNASTTGAVTIDVLNAEGKVETSTGQLNVGSKFPASGFVNIPSGSKTFRVTFGGATQTIGRTIPTEKKVIVSLINPDSTSSSVALILSEQGYTFEKKNSKNTSNVNSSGVRGTQDSFQAKVYTND